MMLETLLLGLSTASAGAPAETAVLRGGDRVALIGAGLIEYERLHGYLETRLTRCFPKAVPVFRNFGWAGDTPLGDARTSGLGKPDGLARLLKDVQEFKPTVLILGYGMNESFAGPAGLSGFLNSFEKLLEHLEPLKARVVVLSPIPHENLGRSFPDPAEHNRHLQQYSAALQQLAARRKLPFINLFNPLVRRPRANSQARLTTNGVLPSAYGYWVIGGEVEHQLVNPPDPWAVALDRDGKLLKSQGAEVRRVECGRGGLQFTLVPALVPAPPSPTKQASDIASTLRIAGLAPGSYVLQIDGHAVRRASAEEWAQGILLDGDPGQSRAERLRLSVVRKNELFTRRSRPFNDFNEHWTYIAGDAHLYDALVSRQEKEIARLCQPAPLRCRLVAR